MADLKTKIGNIDFPGFIFNASGPDDVTLAELEKIGRSDSAAIKMKSCTLEARTGNEEPRYADLPKGSIQSMGLPNLGYKKYLEFIPKLKKFRKPIIASIAGLCAKDYPIMVSSFQKSQVDLIEINLSCPNIKGKPQIAYDFAKTEKILSVVSKLGKKPMGLKLPAYYDFVHHQLMAKLIAKYKFSFVTCINSIGNCLVINPKTEKPLIKPKGGFGGLGGATIKPVALANVKIFYDLLPKDVAVIGVGGIYSGLDAFEFLLAGSSAVQVASVFSQQGVGCFKRIQNELNKTLNNKKYSSVLTARGQLKQL